MEAVKTAVLTLDSMQTKGLDVVQNGNLVNLSLGDIKRLTNTEFANDIDVADFMLKCALKGANPLLKEAYLTAYKDKSTGKVVTTTIFSKEFFVKKAEEQSDFNGMTSSLVILRGQTKEKAGVIVRDDIYIPECGDILLGATASVYRKGMEYPITATVRFSEYNTGMSLWKSKPATMIRKVAIVQALREAYGGLFNGVYTEEENRIPDNNDDEQPTSQAKAAVKESMKRQRAKKNIEHAVIVEEVEEVKEVELADQESVQKMVAAFEKKGVSVKQIEEQISCKIDQINTEQLDALRNWYKSIK